MMELVAGYSGTPLPTKLGIKAGHRVVLLDAPAAFASRLAPLPPVTLATTLGPADVIVLFTTERAVFERRFDAIVRALDPTGGFWVAWPKRAAKVATDMTEDVVRAVGLPRGLVDNKVCAIDEIWSGLRLVVRVENRPRPARAGKAPSPARARPARPIKRR
jgi:hypothetical protein